MCWIKSAFSIGKKGPLIGSQFAVNIRKYVECDVTSQVKEKQRRVEEEKRRREEKERPMKEG